jgi:phage regulator Rha-like protein
MCYNCFKQKSRQFKLEFRKAFGILKKSMKSKKLNKQHQINLIAAMQKLRTNYVLLKNMEVENGYE